MAAEDKTSDIVERLRDVGCDREPFTPDHAACVCRLTNEAASTITSLRSELDDLRHDIERHIKIASEAVTELDAHRDCVQALRLLRKNIQQGVSHPGYSEWLVQQADAALSRLESPSGERGTDESS